MRLILASVAFLLCSSTSALAQVEEWTDFVSRDDGFRVNFPGAPKVTTTTYMSEYGADLPARVYSNEGLCQIVFFESDELCEVSYKDKKGKYQSQQGIVLPKI